MASIRNLRKEASSLLRVAKQSFRFIREFAPGSQERENLLAQLRDVIDRADPPSFDDSVSSLNLTMTNQTADAVIFALTGKPELADVLAAVKEGLRRTKQRAYLRLDLNHIILKELHFVLLHTPKAPQVAAFKRLAREVEKGMAKNPMEILARMGM